MSADQYNIWAWAKSWITTEHINNLVQVIMDRPEEDLMEIALSIRSIRPTPVGKAFIELEEVQNYVAKLFQTCTLLMYVINDMQNNPNCHWTYYPSKGTALQQTVQWVLDKDICLIIGERILGTDFWKKSLPDIKKQHRDLKKIEKVMHA